MELIRRHSAPHAHSISSQPREQLSSSVRSPAKIEQLAQTLFTQPSAVVVSRDPVEIYRLRQALALAPSLEKLLDLEKQLVPADLLQPVYKWLCSRLNCKSKSREALLDGYVDKIDNDKELSKQLGKLFKSPTLLTRLTYLAAWVFCWRNKTWRAANASYEAYQFNRWKSLLRQALVQPANQRSTAVNAYLTELHRKFWFDRDAADTPVARAAYFACYLPSFREPGVLPIEDELDASDQERGQSHRFAREFLYRCSVQDIFAKGGPDLFCHLIALAAQTLDEKGGSREVQTACSSVKTLAAESEEKLFRQREAQLTEQEISRGISSLDRLHAVPPDVLAMALSQQFLSRTELFKTFKHLTPLQVKALTPFLSREELFTHWETLRAAMSLQELKETLKKDQLQKRPVEALDYKHLAEAPVSLAEGLSEEQIQQVEEAVAQCAESLKALQLRISSLKTRGDKEEFHAIERDSAQLAAVVGWETPQKSGRILKALALLKQKSEFALLADAEANELNKRQRFAEQIEALSKQQQLLLGLYEEIRAEVAQLRKKLPSAKSAKQLLEEMLHYLDLTSADLLRYESTSETLSRVWGFHSVEELPSRGTDPLADRREVIRDLLDEQSVSCLNCFFGD